MPLIDASLLGGHRPARASKRWRHAARLVSARWDVFLVAERKARAFAFASYTAALDAEEAAAAELATLVSDHAA